MYRCVRVCCLGKKATQEVISQVPLTTNEEFKAAVAAAKQAFPYLGAIPL